MGKWPMMRLGEIIEIKKGTKIEPCDNLNGNIRYIQIEDLRSNNNIKFCSGSENKRYVIADEEDLIIAWDGANAGTIGYGLNGAIGSTLALLRVCKKGIFDVRYLGEYLKSKFDYLQQNCTGATIPHINRLILENIKVPVPPIIVQKHVADTLDKTQEIIDGYKKLLAELDNLVMAVFYEMFGDPGTNDKNWEVVKIKDLAKKIQYGTSKKASTEKLEYPILRMNNITYSGELDLSDLKYISLSDKEKEKYLVHKGEILFNRTNSKELVGKCAVFKYDYPMAYAGYLIKLTPNEKTNGEFISAFLNSKYGKALLKSMAKNIIGMANINAKELGNIRIYLPPLDLQNKFADIVTKIEEQKALVKQAISESEHLFNSLMSEYFD